MTIKNEKFLKSCCLLITLSLLTNCTLLIWLIYFAVLSTFLIVFLAEKLISQPFSMQPLPERRTRWSFRRAEGKSLVAFNSCGRLGASKTLNGSLSPLGHYKNISRTKISLSTAEQAEKRKTALKSMKYCYANLFCLVLARKIDELVIDEEIYFIAFNVT